MSELQKEALFELIKSLSKSEKRQFRLYVNRLGINADAKFLLLFGELDKAETYDEKAILKKKITTKTQLSNLKAHLYKQILISLRTNPMLQNIRLQIREQLDFAELLYNKGLYKQSLKILEKAKQLALRADEKNIAYEIIDFEKNIESQYITRSKNERADALIFEAKKISLQNVITSKLSNMALKLYGSMLKDGYVKDEATKLLIEQYFTKNIAKVSFEIMDFREQLWFYQAYVWKSLLLQNFEEAYTYATKWVTLFYENPDMIAYNPIWFLKGNNYLLEAVFLNKKTSEFNYWWNKLNATIASKDFPNNENVRFSLFVDTNTNVLNSFFLKGNFSEYKKEEAAILAEIAIFGHHIDPHHILIMYFKMAALSFINTDYRSALEFTSKIVKHRNNQVQSDLLYNSHILSLMAQFDSGLDENFEESAEAVSRFVHKMQHPTEVQKTIAQFFIKLYKIYPSEQVAAFSGLLAQLYEYAKNPYNRRSVTYLDVISWAESKVQNIPVSEVILRKLQGK
ncbi:MAG: hypothetical protein Q4G08_04505 [Capnocytophaga sp.]|nr:hypothetical protein [Capnocytophaga sp.]